MINLFGQQYTLAELKEFTGALDQIAGIRMGELADGNERGVRTADFYTGSGFEFTVLPDRGLDIGVASYQGRPLAFKNAPGYVHPAYFEPEKLGWLRTFGGGLMTGCGLNWFGAPTVDNGQELGLHGRLSHTPARNVSVGSEWQGEQYVIWIEGTVREAALFGPNLYLTRRISTALGSNRLRIEDTVINDGFIPAEHMMLYHCNFGFPVVSPDTVLDMDAETSPRDAIAETGFAHFRQFEAPTHGRPEEVFYHRVTPDEEGYGKASLINPKLGLGVYVRFRMAELPCLVEWKCMASGWYVCGLEPATAWVTGRDIARQDGLLRVLQPGERISYAVEIGVIPTL
ncbi:MAG TPA: aldose 1-epimerase family protein [Aggregatilineaceae bacterium]|nr:aldose 1-epimerase family protein [Aggregatilineaceae bacterium]